MHSLRFHILTILLLLLLGAIVNVAVAWACSLIPDPTNAGSITQTTAGVGEYVVQVNYATRFGSAGVGLIRWADTPPFSGTGESPERFLPGWFDFEEVKESVKTLPVSNESDVMHARAIYATGWPAIAVRCTIEFDWPGGVTSSRGAIRWFDRDFDVINDNWPRALPCYPIPTGFALNTLFYAAIFGLLYFAPRALRRRRRIQRGLCPRCAYPTGSSEVCTECGTAIRVRESSTLKPTPDRGA